jgi:Uma2 family endonuclease
MQPEALRLELIAGELVQKALPDFRHAEAQFGLADQLRPEFHRRGGGGHPGGWWIGGEVDIQLGEDGFRPDLSGWRRDRVANMPGERPVGIRPDWVCEALSQSNASNDTILKMWHYHQAGIPHYWLLDPDTKTLAVYRDSPEGYINVLVAHAGQSVRAEPFEAVEIRVGLMFGEDRDD